MTTARPSPPPEQSVASARIRPLVLTHAADLFAERGPAATSLRDIAARSGVNQGLIFRHIGNKEAVVAAVLDHLADDLAAGVDAGLPRDQIEVKGERQLRVLARALLDGYDVGRLQHRFPNIETLLKIAEEGYGDGMDGRLAVADAVALQLGWRLFAPFLQTAAGLPDSLPSEWKSALDERIARMLAGPQDPAIR